MQVNNLFSTVEHREYLLADLDESMDACADESDQWDGDKPRRLISL